ncbi:hypothetical protein VKT23_001354 [Stygiomarasmius scandens]|uniref:Transmembrane protein n=1 Tax=Marasmiellus scandens TaxID=2682957 RepID=A0ABR1KA08_9AGAR
MYQPQAASVVLNGQGAFATVAPSAAAIVNSATGSPFTGSPSPLTAETQPADTSSNSVFTPTQTATLNTASNHIGAVVGKAAAAVGVVGAFGSSLVFYYLRRRQRPTFDVVSPSLNQSQAGMRER